MKQYTEEELNKLAKSTLVTLFLAQQGQLDAISKQLGFLTEQIALMNQRAFGRKSEKAPAPDGQISLFDNADALNEAESLRDDSPEPPITEIVVASYKRGSKKSGRRDLDLDCLPARIVEHKLPDEELASLFPNGCKELPEVIYKRLAVIPETFIVDEHHVHVYASKDNDGTIVKAARPADIFRNSVATPSLLSFILNNKYVSHIPLDRQSRLLAEKGVTLKPNTLANWAVRCSEDYLSLIYDELHAHLGDARVIHADETPFTVIRDGRPAGSKSYMWVYCSSPGLEKRPVILFDHRATRGSEHPKEFLSGYSGVVVSDAFQAYHKLDRERGDITVAGCWVHAKRGFSEITRSLGSTGAKGTIAAEAESRILEIFHLDNQLDGLSKRDRERQRNLTIKPKVNAFFAWAKKLLSDMAAQGQTAKALQYCINQEQYLRVFLKNGDVPMDNNAAERAIRPFTLGRKNWVSIDSAGGARASSIIYSIVETAKANGLNVYQYLEMLFTEMPPHLDDKDKGFLADLMPWSEHVQKQCRAKGKA